VKSKTTKIKKEEKGFTTKGSLETSKQTQATDASYTADRLLKCDVIVRYWCSPRMLLSVRALRERLLKQNLGLLKELYSLFSYSSYDCAFSLTSFLIFTALKASGFCCMLTCLCSL
jgi:hypothetical protein